MAGFRRVFNSFPGFNVLGNIESINVIDIPPPAIPLGAGTIVCACIGEFEDGPVNTPIQVFGGSDLSDTFGALGFTKGGAPSLYPVAQRSAGASQPWEGNGFIALRNKRFAGLIIVRVDSSAGEVTFAKNASLTGAVGPYSMTSGDTVDVEINGGAAVTATFTAARAVKAGAAGTFPTGFLGGETLEIKVDGGPTQVVVFTAAAQTNSQVVAEINAQTASDIAVVNGAEVDLRSIVAGTAGTIEVVGGTGAATIGQLAGAALGSGNVANIAQVQASEAATILDALVGVGAGVVDGRLRIFNSSTPGTGTIEVSAVTGTATALGLTVGLLVSAAAQVDATVPAGTLLRDTATQTLWLTTETATVRGGGPFSFKVRPAIDTDSAPTAALGTITQVVDVLPDVWTVTNAAAISRLSNVQMDQRYADAFAATIGINGAPVIIDEAFSARATATIHRTGRENAVEATRSGHRPRKFVAAPPIGTSRTDALASSGIGVGANRDERVFYAFPGGSTLIPEIARVGNDAAARGPGFTADGVIDVKADSYYASVRSLLPPEENAGQRLSDTPVGALNLLSLEAAYDPERGGIGLTIDDYINFKANGVIALRADRTAGLVFQSDVTSVNPAIDPSLADAKRRYMGDFLIASFADISASYVKKLNTPSRRRAFLSTLESFLEILRSPNQPEASRIEAFSVVDDTTAELRSLGFQVVNIKVRLFASIDSIVLRTEVGTTVTIDQIA